MGTRSATGTIKFVSTANIQNQLDSDSTGTAKADVNVNSTLNWTSGTAADQADRVWQDFGRTITGSSSEDVDMYDLASFDAGSGAGLDALGQSIALVEVCSLYIHNQSGSAGTLYVGAKNATTAWNSIFGSNGGTADNDNAAIILPPDSKFMIENFGAANAFAVAVPTNHLLTMYASGGNVTYDIQIIGRSA